MKILVTGAAGFIGYHLIKRLLQEKHDVVGFDNINDYYDPNLKYARLKQLGIEKKSIADNKKLQSSSYSSFHFFKMDLEDGDSINTLFANEQFDVVCNLAAQAGVRYSLEQPLKYISSNIVGFTHILEACRYNGVKNLIYASSSSVYGLNSKIPFHTDHHTDHPVSVYAATKKANELLAHTYSHLYNVPTTGLRFFTVYGPWGRPDMAYFSFTKAILEGKPIKVFNGGEMMRDFTFIDDIVEGIYKVILSPATPSVDFDKESPLPSHSSAPFRVYNIGNNKPVSLLHFINAIEKELGVEAIKEFCDMQPGDVYVTYADVEDLVKDFNYQPNTTLEKGIGTFIDW